MNTTIWNPIREMENLLNRYTQPTGRGLRAGDVDTEVNFAEWSPTVDIEENDESFLIRVDVPGVDRKDIDVRVDNGVLSITGEKHVDKETGEGTKRHHTERYCGTFARGFTLPTKIKADKVDASYKDGVLSLTIPKAEEAKPKAIDIKVH